MKNIILFALLLAASGAAAQNEIKTPAGQSLKIVSDTLVVNGNLRINNGILKLNNYRFLSTAGLNNTFVGHSGNTTLTGRGNSFIGFNSGLAITSGYLNTFIGGRTGQANTSGGENSFIGYASGNSNTIGNYNTFIGNSSGNQNTTGDYNVMLGNETGSLNITGQYNTYIGRAAGAYSTTGSFNTYIGYGTGGLSEGSYNVFLGLLAGQNEMGSNKLYIDNSNTDNPLVYGDFDQNYVVLNGKVGVSTSNFPTSVPSSGSTVNTSGYTMFVKGGILAEQVTVASGWADYVFEQNYKLKPLTEVEAFIKSNGHLPNVPPARDVEKYGVNLGDMAVIQQEKIEELTLYSIDQQKQLEKNAEQIREIEQLISEIAGSRKVLKSKK